MFGYSRGASEDVHTKCGCVPVLDMISCVSGMFMTDDEYEWNRRSHRFDLFVCVGFEFMDENT